MAQLVPAANGIGALANCLLHSPFNTNRDPIWSQVHPITARKAPGKKSVGSQFCRREKLDLHFSGNFRALPHVTRRQRHKGQIWMISEEIFHSSLLWKDKRLHCVLFLNQNTKRYEWGIVRWGRSCLKKKNPQNNSFLIAAVSANNSEGD